MSARRTSAAIFAAAVALTAGDAHLYAGANHFRDGRFQEAFVEFSVARQRGAGGEAAWYSAAALVKLGRAEDAVEEFADAERLDPAGRDTLLDYYRALACYDARLYLCADQLLAAVGAKAGPKVAGQANKLRGDLRALFAGTPATTAIDWYHLRGAAAVEAGRGALARAYYQEAIGLARLRPDKHREAEAREALSAVKIPPSARAR